MVLLITGAVASQAARAQSVAAKQTESGESGVKEPGSAKPTKRSDADVQNILDSAAKALDAGKVEQTAQQINGLLASGRLQARSMARALYLRGAAHHKQGKHAQAIADLTSALWLKSGLSDADRSAATALRSEAYRQAGLNDLADADARKAGRASGSTQTASAASAPAVVAARGAESPRHGDAEPKVAAAAPQQSASPGGVSGFLSNLFGGSSNAPSTARSTGVQQDPYRAPSAKQPSVGEAWSTSVAAKPAASAKQVASVKEETAAIPAREEVALKPATATPKPQGRYRLQVAAVRGRAEAQGVATRLKKDYAAALGGREPEVDETVIGNMGTFYRVRIGPFADAVEPGALCTKLRGIGLDCLIMAE
jgi:hypothetical protein